MRAACTLGTRPCSAIATRQASVMRRSRSSGVRPIRRRKNISVRDRCPISSEVRSCPRTFTASAVASAIAVLASVIPHMVLNRGGAPPPDARRRRPDEPAALVRERRATGVDDVAGRCRSATMRSRIWSHVRLQNSRGRASRHGRTGPRSSAPTSTSPRPSSRSGSAERPLGVDPSPAHHADGTPTTPPSTDRSRSPGSGGCRPPRPAARRRGGRPRRAAPAAPRLPGRCSSSMRVWTKSNAASGRSSVLEVDLEDLEVRARRSSSRTSMIGGDDAAALADPRGEPARERAAARAGLEAVPAGADPQRIREAHARRVVARLEQLEAAPGELPGVGERVGHVPVRCAASGRASIPGSWAIRAELSGRARPARSTSRLCGDASSGCCSSASWSRSSAR